MLLCLGVVVTNLLAYQHAHAMLHFSEQGERTDKPEALSLWQRISVLVTGVNIPKPLNATTPDDYGLLYETHRFGASNEIELEAWYIPKAAAKGIVLMFHGYAASKATLLPEAQALNELGYETLLVDFRGSGGSSGYETSVGFYEAEDVVAAVEYVQRELGKERVVLYGQSMGGAAIFRAVAEKGVKPERIIVEAVFDRMVSTVANRFRSMGLPAYPGTQLLIFWGSIINGYWGFEHNPVNYAAQVENPVLVLHGTDDERATLEQGQAVFEQIRGEKRFESFEGVGHESYIKADGLKWKEVVAQFLSQPVQE